MCDLLSGFFTDVNGNSPAYPQNLIAKVLEHHQIVDSVPALKLCLIHLEKNHDCTHSASDTILLEILRD